MYPSDNCRDSSDRSGTSESEMEQALHQLADDWHAEAEVFLESEPTEATDSERAMATQQYYCAQELRGILDRYSQEVYDDAE